MTFLRLRVVVIAAWLLMPALFLSCKSEQPTAAQDPALQEPEVSETPAAASPTQPSAIDPTLPEVPAAASFEQASFTLIYTTGVVGELVDCGCPSHPRGGLARRAQWVKGLKGSRTVIQVDGGDCLFPQRPAGAPVSDDLKARANVMARGLSAMGIDAVNVGDLELEAGIDFLQKELMPGDSTLPFLSANLVSADTGERIFAPFKLVTVDGAQLGIFGITAGRMNPPGVSALDPQETAAKMIAALKDKCSLVIGLYAMDIATASRIAKETPGADLIVVSERSAGVRHRPMVIGNTLLLQSGNRGMFIGRMDITLSGTGQPVISQEEQAEIEEELELLTAQSKLLEGPVGRDPEIRQEYMRVTARERELNDRLGRQASRFEHSNSVVSMDLEMPEDPDVAKWIDEIGVKPKTKPKPKPAGQ